jgi:hypothetical protein
MPPKLHLLVLLGKRVHVILAGKIITLPNLHLLILLGKQVDVILAGKRENGGTFSST